MKSEQTPFRTIVETPLWKRPIKVTDRSTFLGSCFAQHIGGRFQEYGLHAVCNPFGVLYNPESISLVVRQSLLNQEELPIFHAGDEWRCWWAGTQLAGRTRKQCSEAMKDAMQLLDCSIRQSQFLFLTLGTNVCYRLLSSGMTVANCHRAPQSLFQETRLSTAECVEILSEMIKDILAVNPHIQIVFTVSPFRYAKYGFHGSQLAKATLLLTVDELCSRFPASVSYLPAYEIVMDELRDYRFYADDMLHPSPVAIDYIWQRMKESCMSPLLQQYLQEYEPVRRAFLHRPAKPSSAQYQAFIQQQENRRRAIMEKYEQLSER